MRHQIQMQHTFFQKPQKAAPPSFEDVGIQRAMNDSKDKSMFILTDEKGMKICTGTYYKCDAQWGRNLDHSHYSMAGILWFIFNGTALRMPGY